MPIIKNSSTPEINFQKPIIIPEQSADKVELLGHQLHTTPSEQGVIPSLYGRVVEAHTLSTSTDFDEGEEKKLEAMATAKDIGYPETASLQTLVEALKKPINDLHHIKNWFEIDDSEFIELYKSFTDEDSECEYFCALFNIQDIPFNNEERFLEFLELIITPIFLNPEEHEDREEFDYMLQDLFQIPLSTNNKRKLVNLLLEKAGRSWLKTQIATKMFNYLGANNEQEKRDILFEYWDYIDSKPSKMVKLCKLLNPTTDFINDLHNLFPEETCEALTPLTQFIGKEACQKDEYEYQLIPFFMVLVTTLDKDHFTPQQINKILPLLIEIAKHHSPHHRRDLLDLLFAKFTEEKDRDAQLEKWSTYCNELKSSIRDRSRLIYFVLHLINQSTEGSNDLKKIFHQKVLLRDYRKFNQLLDFLTSTYKSDGYGLLNIIQEQIKTNKTSTHDASKLIERANLLLALGKGNPTLKADSPLEIQLENIIVSSFKELLETEGEEEENTFQVENFYEKFMNTFWTYRNRDAILTYMTKLRDLEEEDWLEVQPVLLRFITSVLEGTFVNMRYDENENIHLTTVFGSKEGLKEEWMRGSAYSAKELFTESDSNSADLDNYSIVDTDNPSDLLLVGTEGQKSCQRVNGDPEMNCCLLAYLVDGKNRVIAVKDKQSNRIVGRCIIRILWDKEANAPILFKEKNYVLGNDPTINKLINNMCIQRAKTMNIDLIADSEEQHEINMGQYSGNVSSLFCPAPFEYVDSGPGKNSDEEFSIENPTILHQQNQ